MFISEPKSNIEKELQSSSIYLQGPFGSILNGVPEPEIVRVEPGQGLSRTAPARLQALDDDSEDEHSNLVKVENQPWFKSRKNAWFDF